MASSNDRDIRHRQGRAGVAYEDNCFSASTFAPEKSPLYTVSMSQPIPDFHSLSVAERIQLVEDIWDSIVSENPESATLTPAQFQEIQDRLDAHDEDPSSAASWDQVRSELFQRNR